MRSRSRTVLAWTSSLVASLVLAELVARIFFAAQVGPRLLLYGTPWYRNAAEATTSTSVQEHGNDFGGYAMYEPGKRGTYSKYFPNERKYTPDPDTQKPYPVRINNHGFRGADFAIEKAPGTIRVLTLGASSTFGYHDRDDETYPYYLGQILNRDGGGRRFEVINFAIPHAMSENILAMFLAEGLALKPDVITYYQGANDAVVLPRGKPGLWDELREGAGSYLVLAKLANETWPVGLVDRDFAWSDELAAERSAEYLGNVREIARVAHANGIDMIVATQQMQSQRIPRERMHGLTYAQELAGIRADLASGKIGPHATALPRTAVERMVAVFDSARVMLVHARLMDDLRAWAAGADVGFVDVIHVLDQDRDQIVHWVHLRAPANEKIAEALAHEILARLDRRKDGASATGSSGSAAPPPAASPAAG
jgi:lysophospholipase L1-like esterase